MAEITQVRLSGFGGQGVVLAGVLLGEAGVIDGKHVAGSNSYGAQARGSGCKSEIVFSNGPIDFPHLITADILVAMSQGAYQMYYGDVRETSGLILYEQGQVTPKEGLKLKQIGIPGTEQAQKKLKNKQAANIVLLGALIASTQIVSLEAMEKAIQTHVSERFRSLNLEALKLGLDLGRQADG
ncbi:MAG TPA: 2-oxoacid:acceptor oxidoreductase family protein [Thermodesulfobacteriota bacterium]|nr:2-oxoacid:acceptor oxidoreductase family protein [Thermodesulfobacteriota bacterium]